MIIAINHEELIDNSMDIIWSSHVNNAINLEAEMKYSEASEEYGKIISHGYVDERINLLYIRSLTYSHKFHELEIFLLNKAANDTGASVVKNFFNIQQITEFFSLVSFLTGYGKSVHARHLLNYYQKIFSSDKIFNIIVAGYYFNIKEFSNAVVYYEKYLTQDPGCERIHALIGMSIAFDVGMEKGLSYLKGKIQSGINGPDILVAYSRLIFLKHNDFSLFLKNSKFIYQKFSDSSESVIGCINALMENCDFNEAANLLKRSELILNNNEFIHLTVKLICLQGFIDDALAFADKHRLAKHSIEEWCFYIEKFHNICGGGALSLFKTYTPPNYLSKYKYTLVKKTQAIVCLSEFDSRKALRLLKDAAAIDPEAMDVHVLMIQSNLIELNYSEITNLKLKIDLIAARAMVGELIDYSYKTALVFRIVNDILSNGYALAVIEQLKNKELHEKIDILRKLLIHEPEYLGAAIAFIITSRVMGLFNSGGNLIKKKIPKLIVQYWHAENVPADLVQVTKTWQKSVGYDYYLYNMDSALNFLNKNFSKNVSEAFLISNPTVQSDIFRIAYLYVNGGIYVDCDDLCRNFSYEDLLDGSETVFQIEKYGTLGNNFIATVPGVDFFLELLIRIVKNIEEDNSLDAWIKSGPGVLSLEFARYYAENITALSGVKVISYSEYSKYVSQHLPVKYKLSDTYWLSPVRHLLANESSVYPSYENFFNENSLY